MVIFKKYINSIQKQRMKYVLTMNTKITFLIQDLNMLVDEDLLFLYIEICFLSKIDNVFIFLKVWLTFTANILHFYKCHQELCKEEQKQIS